MLRADSLRLSVVGLPAMAQRYDDDQEDVVGNGIDDPIVADPNAEPRSTPQGFGRWRAGIGGQKGDRPLDARAHVRVELAKRSSRGRPDLDAIATHVQPRSALTCSQGMLGPSSAMEASKASTS